MIATNAPRPDQNGAATAIKGPVRPDGEREFQRRCRTSKPLPSMSTSWRGTPDGPSVPVPCGRAAIKGRQPRAVGQQVPADHPPVLQAASTSRWMPNRLAIAF